MDTAYINYFQKSGLQKKIILFYLTGNSKFCNNFNYLSILDIYNNYIITDYELFVEIMENREVNNVNDERFLSYIVIDLDYMPEIIINQIIKFLLKKKVNYRLFSFQDQVILKKVFWKDYLLGKGIDVTKKVITIQNFMFDNPLNEDFTGVFDWGDLVLPSLFGDYSMINEGAYEYDEVMIGKDDIVFDCGANIGSFSALALSKGSEVHAFEPIPETFSLLNYHLRHYPNSKLYLNNVGLSNQKGMVDFYIRENSGGNSYINFKNKGHLKKTTKCMITTLDDYVYEKNLLKVDFIKVDIEGAERDMLMGAIETIKKYKPKISICTYHLKNDPQVIEDIIKDACSEYKVIHRWDKCYAYV
jgi:FkbM family methyltransferase